MRESRWALEFLTVLPNHVPPEIAEINWNRSYLNIVRYLCDTNKKLEKN